MGVYVDELLITGMSFDDIGKFKANMCEFFPMSDLSLLSYYLGIEIKRSDDKITLCQASYAAKILEHAIMGKCNLCHTAMENMLKLRKTNDGDAIDDTRCQSVIRSLSYLVHTRPNIAYAVGITSRFMESPLTGDMGLGHREADTTLRTRYDWLWLWLHGGLVCAHPRRLRRQRPRR